MYHFFSPFPPTAQMLTRSSMKTLLLTPPPAPTCDCICLRSLYVERQPGSSPCQAPSHRHLPNSYLPFKTQFKLISLVMPLLTPPGRVISSILLPHSILLLISATALIIFLIRFDYALCPMLNSKLLKIATNLFFFLDSDSFLFTF